MMTIRGVNVYPSALEAILREFDEVAEFEGRVFKQSGMDELQLSVELRPEAESRADGIRKRVQEELQDRLGLRIEIALAAAGSLPRYELKAKRFKREAPA